MVCYLVNADEIATAMQMKRFMPTSACYLVTNVPQHLQSFLERQQEPISHFRYMATANGYLKFLLFHYEHLPITQKTN